MTVTNYPSVLTYLCEQKRGNSHGYYEAIKVN